MSNLNSNQMPHISSGQIDMFAFNALAVMGVIAGLHAGNKWIFIYKKDWKSFVGNSDPVTALMDIGWQFFPLDIQKPDL